jgi:hypothetical protein
MMLRISNCAWWALVCLIVVIIGGCGGQGIVPVEGRVTLDGRPLPNATVTLSQLKATDPGPFTGMTDAEGKFTLGSADQSQTGAAPGEYMVMITTVKQPAGADEYTPPPTEREIVPGQWRNGSQRFSVPDGGTKDANFDMTSR